MKKSLVRLAVLGSFSSFAILANAAAGFTALPTTTPFAHPSGTGTTAYVVCNPTGDFGSGASTKNPTTSPDNECYLTPNPLTDLSAPLANYGLVAAANRTVTLNNVYSGNTNKGIGTVLDVVWRKPAA